jgi:hypothetical protein
MPATPIDRAAKVHHAAKRIAELSTACDVAVQRYGHGSPEAKTAYDALEATAAIVHRQARILSGKRRGG